MHRLGPRVAAVVAALLVVPAVAATTPAGAAQVGADPVPVHALSVTGTGVATYPAFDPAVARYGITTTAETAGTVVVAASTSDPAGTVYVNGRLLTGPSTSVSGLGEGDEIAVFFVDSAGTERHTFIYLPARFPRLVPAAVPAGGAALGPGHVLLTLGLWTTPSPFFETAVDRAGVPVWVHTSTQSLDLKPEGAGRWSVSRATTGAGRTGTDVVELDAQFREVARHRTVGLTDTDGHDSLLRPDGSRYLLAYEPDPASGLIDSVVQQISSSGQVMFEWNSADHVDPLADRVTAGTQFATDYAHINSIAVMADGDLLMSFRHLSAVFKVARTAHDGYAAGQVIWRLGGRHSDFTFTDLQGNTDGGPCAQHTASELPNGHILLFDNGAWNQGPLCIDPADPMGATTSRTPTRITEWALDPVSHEATMVWNYSVADRYALFAGSAKRLAEGNTLIGWASSTKAVASEVGATGDLLWDLTSPDTPWFTYRADLAVVPDATSPTVAAGFEGAAFLKGSVAVADYTCADRGGSGLQTCSAPRASGQPLDTSTVGAHTLTVTATDAAGNSTSRSLRYLVAASAHQPDAQLRRASGGDWLGVHRYGTTRVTMPMSLRWASTSGSAYVRIVNDGLSADTFSVKGTPSGGGFAVSYWYAGRNVTTAVRAGTFRTPSVAPGGSALLKVRAAVSGSGVRRGDARDVWVVVRSTTSTSRGDNAVIRALATR